MKGLYPFAEMARTDLFQKHSTDTNGSSG